MITTMTIPPEKPFLDLSRVDGNALSLVGAAKRVLKREGYSRDQIKKFQDEALSDDYDHVMRTISKHCEII